MTTSSERDDTFSNGHCRRANDVERMLSDRIGFYGEMRLRTRVWDSEKLDQSAAYIIHWPDERKRT